MSLQTEHPDVHYWLVTHSETGAFARSLLRYQHRHGRLTGNQLGRVQHMVDCERARQRRWMKRETAPLRVTRADILAAVRRTE
jgi:hypothetical protein